MPLLLGYFTLIMLAIGAVWLSDAWPTLSSHWIFKIKSVQYGLRSLLLTVAVIAFTIAICRVPDKLAQAPKNIHPVVAFLFASVLIAMLYFALAELGKCMGHGTRTELDAFRDRQFAREKGNLDTLLSQQVTAATDQDASNSEKDTGADQDDNDNPTERSPVRRRWWARKMPNRFRSISHRDFQETESSSYYR